MKTTRLTALLTLAFATAASAATDYIPGSTTYTTYTRAADTNAQRFSNRTSFTFRLTDGLLSNSSADAAWTVSSSPAELTYISPVVALSSLILNEGRHQNGYFIPESVTITGKGVSGEEISFSSTGFNRGNDITINGVLHDQGQYTFDTAESLLLVGETYTVSFPAWSMAAYSAPDNGFAEIGGQPDYLPGGMSLTVLSTIEQADDNIPEPATATLSLLALAGLAARRRRK